MNAGEKVLGVTEVLGDLWRAHLGVSPEDESDFMRAGGSSLILMEIQFSLRKRVGVLLDIDSIPFPVTFGGILEQVAASEPVPRSEPTLPAIETFPTEIYRESRRHEGDAWLIGADVSLPASLPSQVRAAAVDCPEDIAVREGESSITYAELVASADQLADEIRCCEPDAEGRVTIIRLEPGIDYCIAVLAAITARTFAAPIHPELPASRIQQIVAEARPVVTFGGPEAEGVPTLPIRRLRGVRSVEEDRETSVTSVNDPCYALFTSGSTGVPKGVRMHQLPVANLARFEATRVKRSIGSRTAQIAPLGFDVAFQEMFGTWAMAGELVTVPLGVRRDPAKLLVFLHEQRITRLYCVPLLLRMIARASNLLEMPLRYLREIVTSGEELRIDDEIRALGRASPQLRIVNQLGAAETIQTTSIDLGVESEGWPEYPELGSPIPGVEIRVTSASGETLPCGIEGEIEVGGFGPALGYLRDLGTDRFKEDEGGRWYRTGDRGQIDSEGRLVYRGRRDHQVKVRGFRIELGDVERNIAGLSSVKDVAVVAIDGRSSGLDLHAMVTTLDGEREDTIARSLADVLPPWMIPSRIRIVDELPQTSSGKIDRRAVAEQLSPDAIRS